MTSAPDCDLTEALEHCRNCLWWLRSQSSIDFSDDQKAAIAQAERLADDALQAYDALRDSEGEIER